jgi:uracil phosphoribosyltransferase
MSETNPGNVPSSVHVIDHPMVLHKLSLMRNKATPTGEFRRLLREISTLMGYEVTRDLPLTTRRVETPMAPMDAPTLAGKKLCLVSIMRAGSGILDGMLDLLPSARVGHIGIYRDPLTLAAVEYYFKVPEDLSERLAIVVNPMLATGHTAAAAIHRLKECDARQIKYICLLAARPGIELLSREHPDVPIYTAAIDETLDERGFIHPGLGDAGDRLFGTK